MAIYKAKVPSNFAIIPNETSQDSRLSFEARGLLTLMLSMPDDWAIHKEWLIKQSPKCGRDKMTRILKELIEYGYVVKKVVHEGGQFNGVDWLVYSEPHSVELKTRRTENQSDCKSNTTKKHSYKETGIQRNNTEHFSKEKRIDVNSLEGYEYCKEAYRFLNLCKPKAENLYTGPLTIEQWNLCEEKLNEVLSEPGEVDNLIFNIHRERKMHNLKSVSLPYILMAFTDCENFAHIAMNCTEWLEEK